MRWLTPWFVGFPKVAPGRRRRDISCRPFVSLTARWAHPCGRAFCGYHGGHGYGRSRSPASTARKETKVSSHPPRRKFGLKLSPPMPFLRKVSRRVGRDGSNGKEGEERRRGRCRGELSASGNRNLPSRRPAPSSPCAAPQTRLLLLPSNRHSSSTPHDALPNTSSSPSHHHQVPRAYLVAQATSLVGAGGAGSAVADVKLPVLPAADAEKEAEDVRLLALVELTRDPQVDQRDSVCRRRDGRLTRCTCRHPF